MAKYEFKIELEDGKVYKYVPNDLTSDELNDLDFFSMQYKLFELENKFKSDLAINGNIKRVVIINVKNPEFEFNLIINNPYMKNLPQKFEKKDIFRNNHPESVITVDKNSEAYKEMRKFLFDNINSKKDIFFDSIYNRKNNLRDLLEKYVQTIKQEINEEDMIELRKLIQNIENELSVYKTYRGFAVSRKKYEDTAITNVLPINNRRVEVQENYASKPPVFKTTQELVNEYNQEDDEEEFLDEDEYMEMAGGEGNEVVKKY